MPNPFQDTMYDPDEDARLIAEVLGGSKSSLEQLLKRHQHYIYNIASKMLLRPADAENATQEVLIKVVTHLAQFRGESSFRTWLYRITFNHLLKMKARPMEQAITTFEAYGEQLDNIPDEDPNHAEQLEQKELIREVNLGCMLGMLLCLDRKQRAVYILGEVFEASHRIGADILAITPANFRKRLERARRDLYHFMNHKCGLINTANPCRCARKTAGFVKAGWVDPKVRKFNADYVHTIREVIDSKSEALETLMATEYQALFQKTPFHEKAHHEALLRAVLVDQNVRSLFNLN